jgi:hypothetical protein
VTRLRQLVPRADIGAFIGNATHPGRVTVFAFRGGTVGALAKVVTSDEGRGRVLHEADVLAELARTGPLGATVPRCLDVPAFHLGAALITDAFDGRPAPLDLTHVLHRWLARCVLDEPMNVLDAEPVAALHAAVQTCVPDLRAITDSARAALRGVRAPRTITHGDFAPWNILMTDNGPRVFDWEFGNLRGVPEWDALHFTIQVGVIARDWHSEMLAGNIETLLANGSPHYDAQSYRAVAILVLAELARRAAASGQTDRASVLTTAAHQLSERLLVWVT